MRGESDRRRFDYAGAASHILAVALHRDLGFDIVLMTDYSKRFEGGVVNVVKAYAADLDGNLYGTEGKLRSHAVTSNYLKGLPGQRSVQRLFVEGDLARWVGDAGTSPLHSYSDADVQMARDLAKTLFPESYPDPMFAVEMDAETTFDEEFGEAPAMAM